MTQAQLPLIEKEREALLELVSRALSRHYDDGEEEWWELNSEAASKILDDLQPFFLCYQQGFAKLILNYKMLLARKESLHETVKDIAGSLERGDNIQFSIDWARRELAKTDADRDFKQSAVVQTNCDPNATVAENISLRRALGEYACPGRGACPAPWDNQGRCSLGDECGLIAADALAGVSNAKDVA